MPQSTTTPHFHKQRRVISSKVRNLILPATFKYLCDLILETEHDIS